MGKLAGKVVVITGANSGIGLASAKRFAAEGARLFITGRRAAELEKAAEEVGHGATGIVCDISVMQDLDALFDRVRQEAGQIDVLFANAGGGDFALLEEVTEAHYARIFDTNVKGTLFTVQKALPLLKDGASVILTGSTSATTGIPAFSVYSASKAAVRNFARGWIMELAPRRIRVNVLVPGSTSTPGWHNLTPDQEANQAMIRAAESSTPLARLAEPTEIAAAALFLASDDSSFVNGSELFADGGAAQI
ncbi:MAG: SDR family oxidoreductase [Yersiniaceae bacterium]|nr:SDR family oxidoreductase [Yersiniaceae bacterium]